MVFVTTVFSSSQHESKTLDIFGFFSSAPSRRLRERSIQFAHRFIGRVAVLQGSADYCSNHPR